MERLIDFHSEECQAIEIKIETFRIANLKTKRRWFDSGLFVSLVVQ